MRCVERDEFLFLGGYGTLLKNGGDGAGGLAGAAVDALIWVDEELIVAVVVRLTLGGMDAVDWANIHTGAVFDTNTWGGDYVGHRSSSAFLELDQASCRILPLD